MDIGRPEWMPAPGPLAGIERRRDQRIELEAVDCRVRTEVLRTLRRPIVQVVPVRAMNVSPTGIGFVTEPRDHLRVGTEVTVIVNRAQASAVIRRVTPTDTPELFYGAEFTELRPAVVEEIFRLTGHRTHPHD